MGTPQPNQRRKQNTLMVDHKRSGHQTTMSSLVRTTMSLQARSEKRKSMGPLFVMNCTMPTGWTSKRKEGSRTLRLLSCTGVRSPEGDVCMINSSAWRYLLHVDY